MLVDLILEYVFLSVPGHNIETNSPRVPRNLKSGKLDRNRQKSQEVGKHRRRQQRQQQQQQQQQQQSPYFYQQPRPASPRSSFDQAAPSKPVAGAGGAPPPPKRRRSSTYHIILFYNYRGKEAPALPGGADAFCKSTRFR